MANEDHLARLKQGVEAWNEWRAANRNIQPDLTRARLSEAHLDGADLTRARLSEAHLTEADLTGANLTEAHLDGAHLDAANLGEAYLSGAYLGGAHLDGAYLRRAHFGGADLDRAHLDGALLTWATLTGATLHKATIGGTIFGDIDLSTVRGLDTLRHAGPSIIGIDTLYRSHGNIPEVFLRGASVPDEMITYSKSLVGQPFQYYSCFISYSSRDEALARRLYADLQAQKVRCWFAPEDLKIGDEFRSRIDESIQVYDRLLLILSEYSVTSRWVQKEVETAFEKESKENRIVLFPLRTDEAVMQSAVGWAADIRRMRHIGDFRLWKDHDAYQQAFNRLLRDLKADI
jgi:TIR domain/Pentapeptide repeats (8 copies)